MRVLYGVSSSGLGHATRSLWVAESIRRLRPDVTLTWVCAEPAARFFGEQGEHVLAVSDELETLSSAMERSADGGRVRDWLSIVRASYGIAQRNYVKVRDATSNFDCDLLIADEFWEILFRHLWQEGGGAVRAPVAFLTDFVKFTIRSWNPVTYLATVYVNRFFKRSFERQDALIFVGEPEAIDDGRWLPLIGEEVRAWASNRFIFTGPILPANLGNEPSRDLWRAFGFTPKDKIVVGTVGGTAIGGDLLHVLAAAYPLIQRIERNCRLVLVCGPRLNPEGLASSEGVVKLGYVHNLFQYLAASDCIVTQAGLATLTEAAAAGVPTIVVPIEGHFEQRANAVRFERKAGFTVLRRSELTAANLASAVAGALRAGRRTPFMSTDGAARAARAALAAASAKA